MSSRSGVVVALGVSQTLAWGSTYYLPAILAVPMARDLGLATGTVFAAFSSALVVSAVLGPAVGRRIDRFGGRDVLAASSLVFALGLLLLGLADGPVLLWAGWLVIGVGMGMGLYESAFSTLAGLYGREARGAITGITLLAGFASTVCWPITGWLNAEFGWQSACFTWAAVHLLLGLPLNRLLIPFGIQPPALHAETAVAEANSTWLPMALLAFVFAVTWFVSTAMAAHLPWLLQIAGLSPAAAIAAAALVGPAQVAARMLEFSLLQRFHPLLSAKLAVIAHPIGALGMMTLGAPLATLFVLLHGAGNGILTIAKGTLPLAIFGPHGYGLRQGVLMVPARFGQALAPLAFALLIERFGTQALLFSSALGLAALVALLVLQTHALKEAT
ncbi:MFS transporter [Halomonas daqingensis]|uniref:MFS transporter n=1 Tax=Billgrantia desiderata TaxID=52021 RepID=UPI001F262D36|nr:MFS transporter [Halomonas desiderata]MCE8028244.1 MFS transporter [Halomonas desiderata]